MSTMGSQAGMGGVERSMRDDVDTIKSDLNNLKNDLRTIASDSAVAGRRVAAQAKDRLGEVAGQVGDKARSYYGAAKGKGMEATEALEERIEEHPLASVGIAFGVGVLLGALVSRR